MHDLEYVQKNCFMIYILNIFYYKLYFVKKKKNSLIKK